MFFSGIGGLIGGNMGSLDILNSIGAGAGQLLVAQQGIRGLGLGWDGHRAWNDWQVNHGLPRQHRQPSHHLAPGHKAGGREEHDGSDAALQAAIAQSLSDAAAAAAQERAAQQQRQDAAAAAAQERAAQQERARREERERRELELLTEAAGASDADLTLQEVLLLSATVGQQGQPAAQPKPRRQRRARRGQGPPPGSTVYAEAMEIFHRNAQLTRGEYRRILERQGLISPEDDVDISHIIAEENGGANHPDNLVCMGRSLNRRLQHRGDHLMVYQVGLAKACKAVAASRLYGNAMRGLYEGRSAEELYAEGYAAMGGAL